MATDLFLSSKISIIAWKCPGTPSPKNGTNSLALTVKVIFCFSLALKIKESVSPGKIWPFITLGIENSLTGGTTVLGLCPRLLGAWNLGSLISVKSLMYNGIGLLIQLLLE